MKRLVEWLLDARPSAEGEGTSLNFSHDFPWPTWVLAIFVLFTIGFVVSVYRRDAGHLRAWQRWILTGLRLTTFGIVLFLISQALVSIGRTGLPYVLVLLDVSNSMGTVDRYTQTAEREVANQLVQENRLGQPTRLAQAQAILLDQDAKMIRALCAKYKLRVHTIAEGEAILGPETVVKTTEIDELVAKIRDLAPAGNETRLGDGLRSALNGMRGSPPTAVILLTDGVNTDGESLLTAAQHARQRSVPLFPVLLGSDDPVVDLELHNVLADDTAFVGEPLAFSFTLTGRGLGDKPAQVILKNAETGERLAVKDIKSLEDGKPSKQEISFAPRAVGEITVVIEASEMPQESNTSNNRETRRISVRDEKLKVLLVENLPRWEYRQLKDLLGREKTVELKTVLFSADTEFSKEDRTAITHMPATPDELFEYDVCILGDVAGSQFSPSILANLRDFVRERGRGLMFIAGPYESPEGFAGTPLESLLPIELEGLRKPGPNIAITRDFRPRLTVEAQKGSSLFRFADSEIESLEVWGFFPGMFWSVDARALRPGAISYVVHPEKLVDGKPIPLIATQRFGAGKVVYHGIDETWRWRFRIGDHYYGRYWVQLLRYLAHSRTSAAEGSAELIADRKMYQAGDPVTLRVRFLNERLVPAETDGVQVVVEAAGGTQQKLQLIRLPDANNVFEGQMVHAVAGKFHAFVAAPSFPHAPPAVDFEVRPSERESRSLRADASELKLAAMQTSGKMYSISTARSLVDDIPPGASVPLEPESPLKLWNHWIVLIAFCVTLTSEWLLRKRWRLV